MNQVTAFYTVLGIILAIIFGMPLILRGKFHSDKAEIMFNIGVSILAINLIPLLTEGDIRSYRTGEVVEPSDIFLASVVIFATFSGVSLYFEKKNPIE